MLVSGRVCQTSSDIFLVFSGEKGCENPSPGLIVPGIWSGNRGGNFLRFGVKRLGLGEKALGFEEMEPGIFWSPKSQVFGYFFPRKLMYKTTFFYLLPASF